MSFNFDQLPEQIQETSMAIQLKEQSLTILNQEQIDILTVIKSQPFADHATRLEKQKNNNQLIEQLQKEIQLLKWKQQILENVSTAEMELKELNIQTKVNPVFDVTVTNPQGTVEVFKNTVRIEQLENRLNALEREFVDQQRHEQEVNE